MVCGICKTINARFVRDHDHRTGFIRGILCERCNSWLGIYEANLAREFQRGRRKYLAWVAEFKNEIEAHLKMNTYIRYHGSRTGLSLERLAEMISGSLALKDSQTIQPEAKSHLISANDTTNEHGCD